MARSWRARASRSPTTPSLAPPVSRSAAVAVVLPCRPPDTAETRDGGGEHGVEIVRSPEAAGHAGRAARASRAAVEAPRRPAGGEHRRRGADCPHCSRPQDRRSLLAVGGGPRSRVRRAERCRQAVPAGPHPAVPVPVVRTGDHPDQHRDVLDARAAGEPAGHRQRHQPGRRRRRDRRAGDRPGGLAGDHPAGRRQPGGTVVRGGQLMAGRPDVSALENLRLAQVYNTVVRYMLDMAVDRGPLAGARRRVQYWLHDIPVEPVALGTPTKVRLLLQELGPTYVKVGQLVSSQSHVLPDDWERELTRLQQNVAPFPYDHVRRIVAEDLGAPPEDLYEHFVKVRRPGAARRVRADLGMIRNLTRVLERQAGWAHEVGLVGVVDEFGKNVLSELDYYGEAYNARRLTRNMQDIPG